jgi:hypothetical protein
MIDMRFHGIDIVIPNWNGRQMLEICLPSLVAQHYPRARIIMVDNGSGDGSVDFVRTCFPDVHVVEFPENRGFSAAVNEGIRTGNNDWVLLLNNDTEMAPDCLDLLMREVSAEPEYKLFALKMVSFHDRSLLDGAGDGVLRGGVGYRLGTLEPDDEPYNCKKQVFGACGGAALYHRSLFETIGWFDEHFFAYLEDVDLNMRAVRAGFNCCYLPEAVVYHIGSATTGSKINEVTVRLTTRNNLYVICKNYSWTMFFRFLPALLIYQLFWLLFVVKKRQFIAYMSGIFQAFSGLRTVCRRDQRQGGSVRLTDREFGNRIIASEREVVNSIMSRRAGLGKNNLLLRAYLTLFC